MAEIHKCIVDYATALGKDPKIVASYILLTPLKIPIYKENVEDAKPVLFLPGHKLTSPSLGPQPSKIMVIGKHPVKGESRTKRLFSGKNGDELCAGLDKAHLSRDDIYLTNIVRFIPPPGPTRMYSWWVDVCMWFLLAEITLVKPEYILLAGSDACKAIIGKKVSSLKGMIFDHKFENGRTAKVCGSLNPAAVSREPSLRTEFLNGLEYFASVITGKVIEGKECLYSVIEDVPTLENTVNRLIEEGHTEFAVDAEWGDQYPVGKLRSIQFSWDTGKAVCAVLRDENLVPIGEDARYVPAVIEQLKRLLERPGVSIVGQNLRGDLKWFNDEGLHLLSNFKFDTMLADYVLEPNRGHSLTDMTLRNTSMGRYDYPLLEYIDSAGLKVNRDAYKYIPRAVLDEYGCQDADATLRNKRALSLELEKQPKLNALFNQVMMPLQPIIVEIEKTGLKLDKERAVYFTETFNTACDKLELKLREAALKFEMENFNPRSPSQVSTLLFDKLGLTPVQTTQGTDWEMVSGYSDEQLDDLSIRPSTNKRTLAVLSGEHEIVTLLSNYRTVYRLTSTLFKPYVVEDDKVTPADGSLLGYAQYDGRVHTEIAQTVITGRWSSRNPNLQNIPARRDVLVRHILGDETIPPTRSCFIADEGYLLLEFDYQQAELNIQAILSGDREMFEVLRNPERDIHAELAIKINKLAWMPEMGNPKKWLIVQGLSHMRDYAKNVVFGASYQGGAFTLYLNMLDSGVSCSVEDAEYSLNLFRDTYSIYQSWANNQKRLVWTQGFVENVFGRRRYFYKSDDRGIMAAQEREAVNYPIQSTVGDLINISLLRINNARKKHDLHFKFALQLHDALYFLVPFDEVEKTREIVPECMRVKIPGHDEVLETSSKVYVRWGETPTIDSLLQHGVEKNLALRLIGNKV